MNHKTLAKMFYGYLLAVVVLAGFLLHFQMQRKKAAQAKVESAQVDTQLEAENLEHNQAAVPAITVSDVIPHPVGQQAEPSQGDPLSYLDVYHQLQTAKACRSFYDFWRRHGLEADVTDIVRPTVQLFGQAEVLPGQNAVLPADQVEILKHWMGTCYQLWLDYGEFKGVNDSTSSHLIPSNDIVITIQQALLSVTPKSSEEMALKATQQQVALWLASFSQLKIVLQGEDSGDALELQAIYSEIDNLKQVNEDFRQEWLALRNRKPSEALIIQQQRMAVNVQIEHLETQIKSQKQVNQTDLQAALADFQHKDQHINQSLRSADANQFYEVLSVLQQDQLRWLSDLGFVFDFVSSDPVHQYLITPDQLVFKASGWGNRIEHSFILRQAVQLYLCDLGWDCGPKSPIMMHYCLLGMGSYPAACGNSLPDFFENNLISPNRFKDVLQLKQLYEDLFNA